MPPEDIEFTPDEALEWFAAPGYEDSAFYDDEPNPYSGTYSEE